MSVDSLKKTMVITNPRGLHMRPAVQFAQVAGKFQSAVTVKWGERSADGKSPLAMMANMLAPPGAELTVEVNGPDARAALDALIAVLEAPPLPDEM
jgi:phosphotransferase system HPr (HPr) family protein